MTTFTMPREHKVLTRGRRSCTVPFVSTTTNPTERLYRVLGTTEDAPTAGCQHCGRLDLKVYVALEPTEGGPIVYFGTTCAARAEKLPVAVIRSEATAADKATAEARRQADQARRDEDRDAYAAWLQEHYGVSSPADLWDLGLRPFAVLKEYHAHLAADLAA